MVTNAHEARERRPILASGVVLHVLPAGAEFDLTTRAAVPVRHRAPDPDRGRRIGHRPTVICARWLETSPPGTSRPRSCAAASPDEAEEPFSDRAAPGRHRQRPDATGRSSGGRPDRRSRHHRDAGLPRRQRLVLRQGDPPRRRPRRARGVPHQHAPRLHRPPARGAARPARALLLPRPSWRLRGAAARGHLARARRRARALALQQVVGHDIRRGKTRQVKGHKGRYNIIYGYVDEQVGLEAGPARRTPGEPPRRGRPRLRLRARSSTPSSCARSAPRSARPHRRSSTRPSPATSRGSG